MKTENFETQLAALERIVRELERGELPLEESLQLFEDGVKLARECQERLNQAERRIEILMRDEDGKPVLEILDLNEAKTEQNSPRTVKRRIVFENDDEESAF